MNHNSTKNQNIKSKFVGIHVYQNVSHLLEYSLNKSYEDTEAPFSWEDVENLYVYKDYNGNEYSESEKEAQIAEFAEQIEALLNRISECEELLEVAEESENTEAIEKFKANIAEYEQEIADLEEKKEYLENSDYEQQEIYEWWAVSQYLAERLNELGHPVITDGYSNFWGRCTTGQAILLDYAISKICAEMEILEGQANEWKA